MAGYYKMEDATNAAINSKGWLHTGDLATMNAQSYLNIVGRLKEMVIRGGENIFPREEELLGIPFPASSTPNARLIVRLVKIQ